MARRIKAPAESVYSMRVLMARDGNAADAPLGNVGVASRDVTLRLETLGFARRWADRAVTWCEARN